MKPIESAPAPKPPNKQDAAALLKEEAKLRKTIAESERKLRELKTLRLRGGKQ